MKQVTEATLDAAARYLRAIDYGEPGTGKTVFGASGCLAPETSPTLFIDYKSQVTSLRSNAAYLEAMKDGRLLIVSLDNYTELDYVYTWLSRGRGSFPAFDKMMEKVGHDKDVMPKVITIDSVSELQAAEVLRRAGNPEGSFLTEVASPEIKHWGSLLSQFTLLANLFFQLPYHIIFSGLEAVDYGKHAIGEEPPIVGHRLHLQGGAQRLFPAYALTVMRLEIAPQNKEGVFNLGYTRSSTSSTKEQTGKIPARIPNPTVPKLVKYLNA